MAKPFLLPAAALGLVAGLLLPRALHSDPAPPPQADLVAISASLANLAEAVRQATVHLSVTAVEAEDRGGGGDRAYGFGTGFVVDAVRGYVVTNVHVAKNRDAVIQATLFDGRQAEANVVSTDARTDIAVLQIPPGFARHQMAWGDSDALRAGNLVMAVGNPYEHTDTTSLGVISGVDRDQVRLGGDQYRDYLQIDAFIAPGSSGGPLVNMRGEVVGVNTAIYGQTWQGIGYAVPSRIARRVAEDLIRYGEARRGYLGIEGRDVSSGAARDARLPRPVGVILTRIFPDGPAAAAGLVPGDVILEVEGREVTGIQNLRARIASFSPGEEIHLKIWRDRIARTMKVVLGELKS